MAKTKRSSVPSRACRLLHLALLWARKGGAFKLDLRMLFKNVRPAKIGGGRHSHRIRYTERELSFEKTPLFKFPKMHRAKFPCIGQPPVDFDEGGDWIYCFEGEKKDEEECFRDDEETEEVEEEEEEGKGIDLQAKEFIERFYEQMRMQRQISLLEYDEMLQRGT